METEKIVLEIFRLKPGKPYLLSRESHTVEFKRAFNIANLAEYGKDIASFANHSGGLIIFGIEDKPHIPIGLQNDRFIKIDEAIITEFLNEHFSPSIEWEKDIYTWHNKTFGIIHVLESSLKPVITTKDGGKKQEVKNGDIYYRYVGRSQKIRYAELIHIIEERINRDNKRWQELFKKIAVIGPENASILDTLNGKIEEGNRTILIDEELIEKIKFIKEGQFSEKVGVITLKLIGEVHPTRVKGVKYQIVHDDPYIHRAKDVADQVSKSINKPFRRTPEHVKCYRYYNIRGSYEEGKEKCVREYCDYKERLGIFMYTQNWIDFLKKELADPEKYQQIMDFDYSKG